MESTRNSFRYTLLYIKHRPIGHIFSAYASIMCSILLYYILIEQSFKEQKLLQAAPISRILERKKIRTS